MAGAAARVLRAVRRSWALQVELHERLDLLRRPWEEELLHWAADGSLHGRLVPPRDGRRRSTTRGGWCPGQAGAAAGVQG
jgi:hypothetical protein